MKCCHEGGRRSVLRELRSFPASPLDAVKVPAALDPSPAAQHTRKSHKSRFAKGYIPMKAPSGLDATARALWRRVVDDLTEREVLRRVDFATIERYVIAEMVARQALARITKREKAQGGDAWTIAITHGGTGVHPDVKVWQLASREAASLAGDLGLTPRARHQLREDGLTDLDRELERLLG
jgi:P27 family predicted phage terminase small subunit